MNVSKAVLITGCSSGIGRATAERLAGVGWKVYATARQVEAIAPLEERGCELLPLDGFDPVAYAGAAAFLTVATLIACWLPARKATRVNPLEALRSE